MLYDQNPDRPDPYASYMANFSALLGIASLLLFYSFISGPVALGIGLWAKKRGATGLPVKIGIITGGIVTALTILVVFILPMFSITK